MKRPAVAVVGVGHMGSLHAEKLRALEGEGALHFAGVYDLDTDRARAVARRLEAPLLDGLEAVCRVADAVCIAVPTTLHAPIAAQMLEAGLDVLVEKPVATTRNEARRLLEVADARGRIVQVGHIERFSRALEAVRPMLTEPRFIEAHRIGPYPGRATDVGVVLDLMIHDLEIVSDWVGVEVDSIDAVGIPVLSETEDIANARIRFRSGCVANLTASRVSLEPLRKLRLFQSDAYISIDFGANRIQVVRREGAPGGDTPPKIEGQTLDLDPADALLGQDRAFAESVRTRTAPVVGGGDGLRALELALRIQESLTAFEDPGA